jgi:hypothetical protein
MASPNSVFTEIVTTTLRQHRKELTDNVSKNNALLRRLMDRGKMDTIDGGYEIVEPLEYAENGTYQRYSGYDTLNISASDVLSAAKYDWKQAAVHVTASGLELRQNSGKNQLINLAKSRLMNAMRSFKNNFSGDIYSDGTASNQVNGLQALVADAGTGTVGGINSSTYTFWKNIVQSAASPLQGGGAITPSSTTIESLMLPLWLELTRGGDQPDLIVASNDYFTFYEQSQTPLKRYTDAKEAQGGFLSLKYKSADVIFDGGSKGGGVPNAHMYFLNTDFLRVVAHSDANMTELDEKTSINQDAEVIPDYLAREPHPVEPLAARRPQGLTSQPTPRTESPARSGGVFLWRCEMSSLIGANLGATSTVALFGLGDRTRTTTARNGSTSRRRAPSRSTTSSPSTRPSPRSLRTSRPRTTPAATRSAWRRSPSPPGTTAGYRSPAPAR